MAWSTTIQQTLCFSKSWFDFLFSKDLLPLAFKQGLITTSWQKSLLNLITIPSQNLPVWSFYHWFPPQAHAIWVPQHLLETTLRSPGASSWPNPMVCSIFSFIGYRVICHLPFWAPLALAILPFITCHFLWHLPYPLDYLLSTSLTPKLNLCLSLWLSLFFPLLPQMTLLFSLSLFI